MIFQDPVAGLNPVISIGDQVGEVLTTHLGMNKREAQSASVDILRQVGLADPERVAKSYPFQLSGGMCQRVMIGIATALSPDLIIADEPTAALDVTVQASILHQLDTLRREKGTAILLITHDFGVVSQIADEVGVMYAGHLVESGPVRDVLRSPFHPYTHGLLAALPRLDDVGHELYALPGTAPDLKEPAGHCPFIPRCRKAMQQCRDVGPPQLTSLPGQSDRAPRLLQPHLAGVGVDAEEQPRLIILTGVPGSGKTTVAKALASMFPRSAHRRGGRPPRGHSRRPRGPRRFAGR